MRTKISKMWMRATCKRWSNQEKRNCLRYQYRIDCLVFFSKTWGVRHLSNQARKYGEGVGVEERQISSLFFRTIDSDTSR